ncbi:MAG: hypothetical protein AAF610_00535 [Pseudomonadota bacterium]
MTQTIFDCPEQVTGLVLIAAGTSPTIRGVLQISIPRCFELLGFDSTNVASLGGATQLPSNEELVRIGHAILSYYIADPNYTQNGPQASEFFRANGFTD